MGRFFLSDLENGGNVHRPLPSFLVLRRQMVAEHSSHGLVVMTPTQHAGGRQFNPGWLYCGSLPHECA
eukprot:2858508-Amphidinium_carterae.1